jgi:hypothetical protein
MRVGREDDDCIAQQGVLFIGGRTPPKADSTRGATARGGSSCHSPLGLGWQRLGGGSTRRLGLRLSKP